MMRVSDISASADFAVEERRELLRNNRWQRRCDVAVKLAGATRNALGAVALFIVISHWLGLL
jgi:hypothetical protein